MASIGAAASYRLLLDGLMRARKRAGGTLPESVESEYVAQLDLYWTAMTREEQDEYEREPRQRLRRAWFGGLYWLRKRMELPRWVWIALSVVIGCSVGAVLR